MPSWIYRDVLGFEEDQRPAFSLQSTLNWARALAFEIRATHGATFADWAASFRTSLAPTRAAARGADGPVREHRAIGFLDCLGA